MGRPSVAVAAPSLFMSITIEPGSSPAAPEIHLHAGGQGVWIARMLVLLGQRPVVCAPVGGEAGQALLGLAQAWDIDLDAVRTDAPSPAYVHDRRDGVREEIARSAVPTLSRHEVDDLYARVLERALETDTCVVTGRWAGMDVPVDFYARLGADLAAAGVQVVGDLHGRELDAYLGAGRLHWLKVSAEDLAVDGALSANDAGEDEVVAVASALVDRGARGVVVSRADQPALAVTETAVREVGGPSLEVVDPTGAGDSMTAALTAGLLQGLSDVDTLKLAWAAGAANVIRHGLGSASRDLIAHLAEQASITDRRRDIELASPPS